MSRLTPLTTRSVSVMGVKLQNAVVYPTASSSSRNVSTKASRKKAEVKIQRKTSQSRANEFTLDMQPILNDALLRIEEVDPTYKDIISSKPTRSATGNKFIDGIDDPILREYVQDKENRAIFLEREKSNKIQKIIKSNLSAKEKIATLIKLDAPSTVILNVMHDQLPKVTPSAEHIPNLDSVDLHYAKQRDNDWYFNGHDVADSSDPDNLPQLRDFTPDEINRILQDVEETYFDTVDMDEQLFQPMHIAQSFYDAGMNDLVKSRFYRVYRDNPDMDILRYAPDEDAFMAETQDLGQTNLRRVLKVNEHAEVEKKLQARWRDGIRGEIEAKTAAEAALRAADDATLKQFAPMNLGDMPRMEALPLFFKMKKWDPMSPALQMTMARIQQDDALENKVLFPDEVRRNQREYMRSMGEIENKEFDMFNERPLGDFHYFINHHYNLMKKAYQKVTDEKHSLVRENRVKPDDVPAEEWKAAIKALSDDLLEFDHEKAAYYRYVRASKKDHHAEVMKRGFRDKRGFFKRKITDLGPGGEFTWEGDTQEDWVAPDDKAIKSPLGAAIEAVEKKIENKNNDEDVIPDDKKGKYFDDGIKYATPLSQDFDLSGLTRYLSRTSNDSAFKTGDITIPRYNIVDGVYVGLSNKITINAAGVQMENPKHSAIQCIILTLRNILAARGKNAIGGHDLTNAEYKFIRNIFETIPDHALTATLQKAVPSGTRAAQYADAIKSIMINSGVVYEAEDEEALRLAGADDYEEIMKHDLDKVQQAKKLSSGSTDGPVINGVSTSTGSLISNDLLSTLLADDVDEIGEGLAPKIVKEEVVTSEEDEKFVNYVNSDGEFHYAHVNDNAELVNTYRQLKTRAKAYDYKSFEEFDDDDTFLETMMAAESYEIFKELLRTGIDGDLKIPELEKYESRGERTFFFWRKFFADLAQQEHLFTAPRNNDTFLEWMGLTKDEAQEYSQKYYDKFTALVEKGRHEIAPVMTKDKKKWDDPLHYQRFMADLHPDIESLDWAEEIPETTAPDMNAGNVDMHRKKMESRFYPHIAEDIRDRDIWNIYFDERPAHISWTESYRVGYADFIRAELRTNIVHRRRLANPALRKNALHVVPLISKKNLRRYRKGLVKHAGIPEHLVEFMEYMYAPRPYLGEDPLTRRISRIQKDQALNYDPNEIRTLTESVDEIKYDAERTKKPIKSNYLTAKTDDHLNGGFDTDKELPDISKPIDFAGETTFDGHTYRIPGGGGGASADNSMPPVREFISTSAARPNFWEREYDLRWRFKTSDLHMSFGDQYGQYINTEGAVVGTYRKGQDFRMQFEETSEDFAGVWGFNDHLYHAIDNFENCRPSNMWTQRTDHQLSHFFHVTDYESKKRMEALRFEMGNLDGREKPILRPAQLAQQQQKQKAEFEVEGTTDSEKEREFMMSALAMPVSDLDRRIDSEIEKMVFEYNFDNQENLIPESDEDEAALFAEYTPEKVDDIKELPIDENALLDISSDVAEEHENQVNVEGENTKLAVFPNDITAHFYDHGFGKYVDSSIFLKIAADPIGDSFYSVEHIKSVKARQGDSLDSFAPSSKSVEDVDNTLDAVIGNPEPIANVQVQEFVKQHNQTTYAELHNLINMEAFKDYTRKVNSQLWSSHAEQFENPLSVYMDHYKKELLALVEDRFVKHPSYKYFNFEKIPLPEFVGGSNQGVRIKSNRKVSTVVDRIQHDFMTVKFNTDDPQLSYTKYKKIRSDFIQEVFDEFDKSLDENEQSVVAEFDAFAKMMGRGDTAEYIQSSTDDDNDFDYAYLSEPSVTISKKHKLFKDTVHTLTSGSASDSAPDLGEATASDVSDGESTANELELSTSEFEEVDLLSKAEYTPSPSPVEVESASEIEESEFEYEEFGEQRADIVYEANTPLPIYIMRDLINSTKNSKSPSSDVLSTNNTISSGLDHVAGDEGYTMVHDVINELYEISKLHSLLNHAQDVVTNATELVESDEEARLPRRRRLAADVADPEYSDIETDEIESNSDYEETDEAEEVTEVAEGEEGVVDEEVDVPEIKVRADEQARRFFSKHFDAERETSEMTSRLDTTFDVFFRAWVDAHVDEIMENLLKINTTYNDSKVADGVVVLGDKTGDSEYQGHALPNAAYDPVVGGHSRQYRKITKSEFAELHQQFLQYATAKQGVRIDYSRLDDLISSLSGVPNIDYNVIYKSIKTGQAHNIDENLILPEETVESGSDQENVQRVIGQIKLLRDSGIVNPTDYGPIFRSSSLLTPFFQTTPVEIPITRSPFYNADGTRKAFQFAPDQSHFSIGIQDVFTRFVNIKGRELLLNDDVHAKYLEFAQKAGFIPAEDPSYSTSELDEHEISLLKEDYKIIDPQDESLAHQDIELAEIYLSKVKIADHIVDSSFGVIAPKASVSPLYTKLMAFVKGLQRRRYADSQLKESNLDVVKFLVEAETLHHLMADYKERKNTFFDGLDLDLDIIAHHKHDPVPLPNPSDAKMTAITARMLYRSVESFAANHDEAAMYSLFNLVAVNGGTYYKRFNYAAQALTAIVRAHPYPRLFSRFCNLSDPVWERLDLVEKKAINIYDGVDSLESSNDYRMYTLTGAEDEFVDKKKKKVNLESESKDTVSTQFNVRVNDLDKQVEDSNVERVLRSIRNTKISQQHIPSADSISVMFERLITRDNTNAILDDLTNTTEALKSPHKILSAINFVSNTGDDRAISAILLAITHGNVEELDALVRLNMLNPILTSDLINYAIRSSIYAFLEEKTKYGTPMYEAALDTLVTLESERQRVLDIRKNNIEDRMSISQFNKLFSEGWNNENIADIVYKPVSFKSNLTAVQTAILEEAKTLRLQNAYDYNQIVKEYKNANVLTDSGRAILMKQGALAQLHSKLKEGNLLSPEVCVSKMLSDDSKVGPNDESTTLLTYGLPNVAGQYGILPLHTLKAIQAKIERNVREATVKTQVIAKTPQEQLDETKPEMLPYYGVEEPFSPETPAEQSHRIRAEKDIENWIQTFFTANDAMKFTLALDDIGKYGENDQFEWANEKKEFAHRNFDLEDYTRKMDMDDNEESEVVQVEKNIFDLQAEADKILETKELNILREKLVMNEQKRYDTHQWEEYEDYVYEKYPDMIDDGTMEFTPIKVDKSDIFEIFERKRWIHFNRNHRPLEEFNDEWMIDIYTKAELWIPGVEDRRIMRERAENSKETVHFDDPDNDGMTKEELAKFENIYTHKEHEQLLDLLRSRRHKTFISGVMSETDWWVNYHYNVQLEYRMQQHHPDESDADYHRVKSIHKQAKLEYVPRLRAERRFLRLLDDQDFYFFENDMDPNWYANDEMVHRMSRRLSPYALIPLSDAVLAPEISIDQQMNLYHLHRLDPATFNIRWIARQLNLPWNKAQILMRVVDMEYKNQVTRGDNYSDELMRNTVTNDLGDCLTTAQELIETLEGTSVDRFFSGSKPKEGSSYAPVVDQDLKITFPYERILHHGDREYDYRMFAPHNIGRVSWDPTYFGDPGWLDDFGGQLRYVNAGNVGFIYKTETMLARKWASKEQMLEAMDRAAFAKFGPLSWAARRGEQQRPPKLPREIIHPEVHAPTNANTMLTITDEKDRHIYSFMIRDRDGYLRHPTFREFRTIRTRLRDRRLSFYWRKFDIVAKLPEISSVYVEQLHKLVMHGADKTVDPEAYDPKDYQQYIVSEQQSNTTLSSH